eukprot:gnl/MRDRNA2_/MRDRNA2_72083_c0_seq1.p1 gnl/MRDRNA2_/MRDRNA2_72083_c0~~gnl/MRDRNA2_/MRDRNA2_72083_c0_seq1.p1  ORF type:complete len:167 (+),score=24.55 gnl/MRDRNA2_/MRDRNA2_72083_c0_seq1:392-892(+)
MDSQRLAWYASAKDPELGERMWRATSRRYFEGKDTQLKGKDCRLDNHELLLECAREAGLDQKEAKQVLADPNLHRQDILNNVEAMHRVGIHAIPVLIFEVEGICDGSWLEDPRAAWPDEDGPQQRTKRIRAGSKCPGREIHHGSGNKEAFKQIFSRLHEASVNARM